MRMLYTEVSLMELKCALTRVHQLPEVVTSSALTSLVQDGGAVRFHRGWKYTLGGPSTITDLNSPAFWLRVEAESR